MKTAKTNPRPITIEHTNDPKVLKRVQEVSRLYEKIELLLKETGNDSRFGVDVGFHLPTSSWRMYIWNKGRKKDIESLTLFSAGEVIESLNSFLKKNENQQAE